MHGMLRSDVLCGSVANPDSDFRSSRKVKCRTISLPLEVSSRSEFVTVLSIRSQKFQFQFQFIVSSRNLCK